MDSRDRSYQFGRSVAESLAHHALIREAGKGGKAILAPQPVELEPRFEPFDPSQTHDQKTRWDHSVPSEAAPDWLVHRLRIPRTEISPESFTFLGQSLSALHGVASLEILATRDSADLFIGATDSGTLALHRDTWTVACPGTVCLKAEDPWAERTRSRLFRVWDAFPSTPYFRRLAKPRRSQLSVFFQIAAQLEQNEAAFFQLLFTPVRRDWHGNIKSLLYASSSRRGRSPWGRVGSNAAKPADQPLFAAAVRCGCWSRDKSIRESLRGFLACYTYGGKPLRSRATGAFRKKLGSLDAVLQMIRQRITLAPGMLLTGEELTAFLHLPVPATCAVSLDWTRALRVPGRFRRSGLLLGANHSFDAPVSVSLSKSERNRSIYMVGSSRKGKTNSILHQCTQLAAAGEGFALIDPHRSAALKLLGRLPAGAVERVVFCDFDDPDFVLDFNPFDAEDSYGRLSVDFANSYKHLFDSGAFYRMNRILSISTYALFELRKNLGSIPLLFSPTVEGERLRRNVAAKTTNPDVRRFFRREFQTLSQEAFSPVLNRLSSLLLDERARPVFTREVNKVDLKQIIAERRILIVALPSSVDVANLVGGMLLAHLQKLALSRLGKETVPFYLFIDEFHRFLNSATILESLINECAKVGVFLCLAHQETGQLGSELLKAALSAPLFMLFGVNYEDARKFAPMFNGRVTVDDIVSLQVGEVFARLDQDVVEFRCPPPPEKLNDEQAKQIIQRSRKRYYTPVAALEKTKKAGTRRVFDTF